MFVRVPWDSCQAIAPKQRHVSRRSKLRTILSMLRAAARSTCIRAKNVLRQPLCVVAREDGKNEDRKLGVARICWCGNSAVLSSFSVKSVWDLQRAPRRRPRERVGGRAPRGGNSRASAAGNSCGMRRWLCDALSADHAYPISSRRSVGLVGAACWNAGRLGADPAEDAIARHQRGGLVWWRDCCGDPYPTSHCWRGPSVRLSALAARARGRFCLMEIYHVHALLPS